MTPVWSMIGFAACGFFLLFSPWTKNWVSFWPVMTLTAGVLAAGSMLLERRQLRHLYAFKREHIMIGLLSAVLLYAVFWAGHFFSTLILPFAAGQINSIYTIRNGADPLRIGLLMLFIIGPAEEIFWRGFIQRKLCTRYGLLCGFVFSVAVYALVHVWSLNFMLVAAAAVCGGFWGLMFLATEKLWPCIISHAVWDVMILLIWPIR
jgi:membrane protease YdiL (CAAX protease family)